MNKTVKLLDAYIYFYHLDKFCVLPVLPETMQDNMNSTFQATQALARSAPVYTYVNSGPRTVTVTLELHRDLMDEVNTNVSNLKDNVVDFSGDDYIDTLVNYLQSIALPKYNSYASGAKTVIPPMVAIRFCKDTFIKGVVSSGIQVTKKKPILSNGKYALVTITFSVSESDPYDADTVAAEGSFRGLTKTFKDGIYASTSSSPTISQIAQNRRAESSDLVITVRSRDGVTKNQKKDASSTTGFKVPSTGVN